MSSRWELKAGSVSCRAHCGYPANACEGTDKSPSAGPGRGLGKSQPGADSNQTQAPATAALLSPLIDFYWGRSPLSDGPHTLPVPPCKGTVLSWPGMMVLLKCTLVPPGVRTTSQLKGTRSRFSLQGPICCGFVAKLYLTLCDPHRL